MKLGWLSLVLLCACAPSPWQVRTLPPCYQPLPDRAEERERAELAAQLALENRGYAVTRREGSIDAASREGRWRLRVTDAGGLEVDAPGAGETPEKFARFGELQQSVAQVRCDELEALRGAVQQRGSGGEHAARLLALHEQRKEVSLGGPISLTAMGAGLVGASISLGSYALLWRYGGCEEDGYGYTDCSLRDAARPTGIAAATFFVAGVTTVGFAVPWLVRTIRKRSALNREIKMLRQNQLTVGMGSVGWQLRF